MNNALRKIAHLLFVLAVTIAYTNAQVFAPLEKECVALEQQEKIIKALNDPVVLEMAQDMAKDPNNVSISSPEVMKLIQQHVQAQLRLIEHLGKKEEKKGFIATVLVDPLKSMGLYLAKGVVYCAAAGIFVCVCIPAWEPLLKPAFIRGLDIVVDAANPIAKKVALIYVDINTEVVKKSVENGIGIGTYVVGENLKIAWQDLRNGHVLTAGSRILVTGSGIKVLFDSFAPSFLRTGISGMWSIATGLVVKHGKM